MGPREMIASNFWSDEIRWLERNGLRSGGHRPDLAAGMSEGAQMIPIEVELARKSKARLRAILGLHASWIAGGRSAAVIYICETPRLANRVRRTAADLGLSTENKTLRVELLDTIREAALAGRAKQTESSRTDHVALVA
jgi:hypothetical protein